MKIAIPTNDWETISTQFFNNKGFAIFEIEGSKIKSQEFRTNKYTAKGKVLNNALHKPDRYPDILNIIKDCDVVILLIIDERIIIDLKKTGIEIVYTDETYVENALNYYLERKCETL